MIVVLTGYGSIATALDALRLGAALPDQPADLDDLVGFAPRRRRRGRRAGRPRDPAADTPSLARVEWEHINRILGDSGGNISEAARRRWAAPALAAAASWRSTRAALSADQNRQTRCRRGSESSNDLERGVALEHREVAAHLEAQLRPPREADARSDVQRGDRGVVEVLARLRVVPLVSPERTASTPRV